MQDLDAIRVHRGRGIPGVETALIDLGDKGHEIGLDAAGLFQDLGQAAKELVVLEESGIGYLSHVHNIGRPFSTSQKDPCRVERREGVFEKLLADWKRLSRSPGSLSPFLEGLASVAETRPQNLSRGK
jgi:hypothetical protein